MCQHLLRLEIRYKIYIKLLVLCLYKLETLRKGLRRGSMPLNLNKDLRKQEKSMQQKNIGHTDKGTAAEMTMRIPVRTRSPQRKSPGRGRVRSSDVLHKIQIMKVMRVTMAFLRKKLRKLMSEVMIHLKSNEFVFFFKFVKGKLTIRRMASSTIINGGLISRKIL